MASTALAHPAATSMPNPIIVCWKETKYEFLKNLRYPMYSVSTIVFPVMFYILFGLIMGRATVAGVGSTTYLIAA
jgi:ABC-2 type transport system permease protein